ncbi:phage tail protein [Candidatus Pantoea persica]|uniref:phage tail protein n=1 Tax=Candidatus Pantoea persica TaxID=2518128 RepID=UPI00215DC274|nr:phage tail protein [Candidatus Pantoea persica]
MQLTSFKTLEPTVLAAQAAWLQQIDLTPLLVYLLDMTEASSLPWLAGQLALTGING